MSVNKEKLFSNWTNAQENSEYLAEVALKMKEAINAGKVDECANLAYEWMASFEELQNHYNKMVKAFGPLPDDDDRDELYEAEGISADEMWVEKAKVHYSKLKG